MCFVLGDAGDFQRGACCACNMLSTTFEAVPSLGYAEVSMRWWIFFLDRFDEAAASRGFYFLLSILIYSAQLLQNGDSTQCGH